MKNLWNIKILRWSSKF